MWLDKKNNWVLIVPEKTVFFLSQLVSISMTGEGLVSNRLLAPRRRLHRVSANDMCSSNVYQSPRCRGGGVAKKFRRGELLRSEDFFLDHSNNTHP